MNLNVKYIWHFLDSFGTVNSERGHRFVVYVQAKTMEQSADFQGARGWNNSGPPSSRCPEYIPKNTSKYHMIILIDVRYSLSYTLVNVPRVTCILPAICVVEWYSRTFESYAKCVVWTKYDQWSFSHKNQWP